MHKRFSRDLTVQLCAIGGLPSLTVGPLKAVGDPGAIIRTNRAIFGTDAGSF